MTIYRQLVDGITSAELVINQNFLIDQVMATGVIAMDIATPPGSPANGDAYIVAGTATGVWTGHEDEIAYWFDESGVWKFILPIAGLRVYVADETADFRYMGGSSSWEVVAGGGTVTEVTATGTVSGLTLSHAGTADVEITLGGTLAVAVGDVSGLGTGVSAFLATPSSANLLAAVTNETGTGNLVFSTSPTFVTPILGTPASGTLTSCTGLPVSTGISGLGTGVATLLAAPSSANLLAAITDETGTGSLVFSTSPTLVTPLLGTPASGTLTNCTGLPISTGISGLASNVATFLATPSSANLIAAMTDETGTGSAVFATSPTLVTPILGTPTSGNASNMTADGANAIGFRHVPQNSQSTAYTTVLADAGKHILHPSADTTARTFTIDSNTNVAYAIGAAITFVNENSAGVVTIAITTDTMRLAGAGTTGSRTLAANGVATALKITSTSWIISGTNLT